MINSFRDSTNTWLSIVLKLFAIIAIIFSITWIGLSIYANFQETSFTGVKNEISIEKAKYEFKINTTNEILLTQAFDFIISGDRKEYILHGFYRIVDDKWKYTNSDLSLNENYFGKIYYKLRY